MLIKQKMKSKAKVFESFCGKRGRGMTLYQPLSDYTSLKFLPKKKLFLLGKLLLVMQIRKGTEFASGTQDT